jgi:hypothetical protein
VLQFPLLEFSLPKTLEYAPLEVFEAAQRIDEPNPAPKTII